MTDRRQAPISGSDDQPSDSTLKPKRVKPSIMRRLQKIVALHPQSSHVIDDSRDSIYEQDGK